MPKESFEQFVKRQKEKLDKAEKVVEKVKEEWKEKIEEFEMVEKSVKELKKLWEENEEEGRRRGCLYGTFFFFLSLPFPEIPPFLLEKVSNKFLKEFDWKKFKRVDLEEHVGVFLSAFLKKNIENYISSQKRKGIKEEKIKPIEIHLDVKELPVRVEALGFQNPKKLHLIIEGNTEDYIGEEMEGGKIIVKGGCDFYAGKSMKGGKIVVEGNCGPKVGQGMEGGEIIVKGDCEDFTGYEMKNGILILEGEVKTFGRSAFSPENKGTVIWKNIKIWENGDWTKEGKEMWEKGEIPVKG